MSMNNFQVNLDYELASGLTIRGKWKRKPYKLIRKLGAGVTGVVYLAEGPEGKVALKVGVEHMSITSEVNVLKQFGKVQGKALGPCLFDVDDYVSHSATLPFYTMEYIQGENFVSFMRDRGNEWLGVLMLQLTANLHVLHKEGWIFGDLKPDNLIVTDSPARVRLLDVGGTTRVGRAIKEYTEYYDRGYWELGTRKAAPSYDIFAAAMIMIDCAYPKQANKRSGQTEAQLKKLVYDASMLKPYRAALLKAIQGKYVSAEAFRNDLLLTTMQNQPDVPVKPRGKKAKRKTVKKKSSYAIEWMLLFSFVLLVTVLYLFGRTF
ncbi:protein kinase domain-containing protein [Shouchella shacheensis]|uniref:protein kinase domain-containing protein n=1 Tax=Shouchella shacheensis TaxID=1649580 RepID=UPI00073FF3A0|nr:serine/threonine protein kinase [Shouchella shacheensis]